MAKNSLVTLSPFWTLILPLAREVAPPTKSSIMLKIDQPLVDLRFQFQYTAGEYFTNEMTNLPYPKALTGFQYYVHYIALTTYHYSPYITTVKKNSKNTPPISTNPNIIAHLDNLLLPLCIK